MHCGQTTSVYVVVAVRVSPSITDELVLRCDQLTGSSRLIIHGYYDGQKLTTITERGQAHDVVETTSKQTDLRHALTSSTRPHQHGHWAVCV